MDTNSFILTWCWESWAKPAFAFRVPIPFTDHYCFCAYFRYRPEAYRNQTDLPMDKFVIDWPWFRYNGWYDKQGKKCGPPLPMKQS